ncbi:MAG: hypothetical protein KatS3mg054_0797 [Chloroflexus sp.]|nr:MAG: hypothetical protein KatS3mg054_0797 [Chloroflexus sp.]GIV92939.1 MAG: hypothetical protein KatS3mg056_1648 [Chloroflexus sp.]
MYSRWGEVEQGPKSREARHAVPLRVSSGASFRRGDACVAPTHVSPHVAPWSRLCITHMSRCVMTGCTRSPWRRLPACVEVSSPSPADADRGRWCAGTNLVQHNRLRAGIACMSDRLADRHEHIQQSRDQDGERCDTHRIMSTAGAAAWLPHAKLRDTHMMRV